MNVISSDCFFQDAKDSKKYELKELCRLFSETLKNFQENLDKIFLEKLLPKRVNDKNVTKQMNSFISQATFHVLELKRFNYLAKHQINASQELMNEERHKRDCLYFRFQGLLREETYLQSKVSKCLEFISKNNELNLIPVEEFLNKAPKSLRKIEAIQDPHKLQLNRMRWEYEQIKKIVEKVKQAEIRKSDTKDDIIKFRQYFKGIQTDMEKIIEAAKPLQTKLGFPFQMTDIRHKNAEYLPGALYYLYLQLAAYNETSDNALEISIHGDVSDEQSYLRHIKCPQEMEEEKQPDPIVEDDDDEDELTDSEIDDIDVTAKDPTVSYSEDLLMVHPLCIHVLITENDIKILLKFYYLIHLQIVTVKVQVTVPEPLAIHKEIWNSNSFFNCLYPNDNGLKSPNPLNDIYFVKYGYNTAGEIFSHNTTGWPYVWVQKLSGLNYISQVSLKAKKKVANISVSEENVLYVEQTLSVILERIKTKHSLYDQIHSLKGNVILQTEISHMCPSDFICKLQSWSVASYEELTSYSNYQELLELSLIDSEFVTVYKAIVKRDSAELLAYIIVHPDYPMRSSLFLLTLSWNDLRTAATNFNLRELEKEINVKCIENIPKEHIVYMLTWQVYHLLSCFDIFLETYPIEKTLSGFSSTKALPKRYWGRPHFQPYKYNLNTKIFSPQ